MSVSEVSLGGAYLKGPDPELHQENAAAVVRRAAELGINYLDTAPGYGPSEELLGPALEHAGRPFRVATKVGFVPEDFDFRRDSVVASLEASLRKLRIDRLAVAQIHEVNLVGWERIMEPGGALDGLRAARGAGLCEAIGITGRAIPLLAKLAGTGEFDTVLVYHDYHPACRKARDEVIPAAAKQDMGIVVGTPLGALFGHEAKRAQTLAALSGGERSCRGARDRALAAGAGDARPARLSLYHGRRGGEHGVERRGGRGAARGRGGGLGDGRDAGGSGRGAGAPGGGEMSQDEVTRDEIYRGLWDTGLHEGDVVLVHSAMRTLGRVQGGADTVVSALLDVIGERGTLVVPTFTFIHEVEDDPIIDPRNDRSEMGAITEAARTHPRALRSTAFRHSFAAIGRRAEVLAGVDPALSVFDLRSAFGVMLALNTQVLMLGMTYGSCTSFHFAEWLCEVPYRRVIPLGVKVRRADGTVVPQAMTDYQPHSYTGTRRPDFHRMGRMLEERKLVGIAAVGNAVARRFAMRDLIDLAQAEAEKDYNVFRTPEGGTTHGTPLESGTTVLSPEMPDAAGRPDRYQWSVFDESRLKLPGG